jgi:hypothetical protein
MFLQAMPNLPVVGVSAFRAAGDIVCLGVEFLDRSSEHILEEFIVFIAWNPVIRPSIPDMIADLVVSAPDGYAGVIPQAAQLVASLQAHIFQEGGIKGWIA